VGDDGRSIFLIGGMNGAGKTSIMEATHRESLSDQIKLLKINEINANRGVV
jgi:predicted ABC-type ATPase